MLSQLPIEVRSIEAELCALVRGVRPTVLGCVGSPNGGVDLLTEDGFVGWRFGLESIRRRLGELDTDAPRVAALVTWVATELEREHYRWRNAISTIRALDLALLLDRDAGLDAGFIAGWAANLRWTEQRCGTGAMQRSGPGVELGVRIARALDAVRGRREVLEPLARIVALPGQPLSHPWHHCGLVAPEDLALLRSTLLDHRSAA